MYMYIGLLMGYIQQQKTNKDKNVNCAPSLPPPLLRKQSHLVHFGPRSSQTFIHNFHNFYFSIHLKSLYYLLRTK